MDIIIELDKIDRSKFSQPSRYCDLLTTLSDDVEMVLKNEKVRVRYSRFNYTNVHSSRVLHLHCRVSSQCDYSKLVKKLDSKFGGSISIYRMGINRNIRYFYLVSTNF